MKDKHTNKEVILHGEAMLFPSELPADAVEIKPTNAQFHIIADSETTGNHHVIDMVPGTKVFKSGNRLFVKNSKPSKVRCVHPQRHNEIALEPNVWEVDRQQEYDHFTQNLRAVRD
jgi:hypothetical protein